MQTAFVTFIYPSAEKFFLKFLKSIKAQTDKDFSLVIFNDSCTKEKLQLFVAQEDMTIEIIDNTYGSIAENRVEAFKKLANSQYEYFIFGDIDDTFAENRVKILKQALIFYPFVFNELCLMNDKKEVFQTNLIENYLKNGEYVNREMLKEENLIGFSHLGLNKEMIYIASNIEIDEAVNIIDWIIVSHLSQKQQAYFEKGTFTNYIFHNNNIALSNQQNFEQYLYYLQVKIKHYSELLCLDKWYRVEMENLIMLKTTIEKDEIIKSVFIDYLNNKKQTYYPWWNQIKNSEEIRNAISI